MFSKEKKSAPTIFLKLPYLTHFMIAAQVFSEGNARKIRLFSRGTIPRCGPNMLYTFCMYTRVDWLFYSFSLADLHSDNIYDLFEIFENRKYSILETGRIENYFALNVFKIALVVKISIKTHKINFYI